jgi:Domain of unknown function (DUF932)
MNKSNLILHCGAARAERQQVYDVPTPPRTGTWVPVAHGVILDEVQTVLTASGLQVVSEAHGLTRDGARYFGLLQVTSGHNPDQWGLVVGVRNSHDKSFPAALALGASVFVCDNLSFFGEVKLARKHTAYIQRDLPQLVNRAVGMLTQLRQTQEQRFLTYQKTELAEAQAHDLVVRSIDAQVLPVTKIPELLQEWRAPRHPEFREGKTAWRLFNAFTETLKGRLTELPRRCQALHGLLDPACGLVVPGTHHSDDAEITVAQAS